MDQQQSQQERSPNNDADRQEEPSYLQQDVKNKHHMKRHPELQPYVPTDRYTLSTNNKSTSNNKINQHSGGGNSSGNRLYSNRAAAAPRTTSSSMTTTSTNSTGLPKKYCSMTRLNQLAQPKRPTTTQNNVPLSSNSSIKPTARPKAKQPDRRVERPTNISNQQQQQQQQQPQQQQQQRPSDRSPPITPITSTKPNVMLTPESTPYQPFKPTSRQMLKERQSTPIQLPTPASSLEEELESANKNDITRDIVIEQVSELSLNDPFYQSAASELVLDSENLNGINYDRNAESLCRELEQDLMAIGISQEPEEEFRSPMLNGKDDSLRRYSAATIVTSDNPSNSANSHAHDEDDRRLKIERELREKAKKDEDDRKQREQIVESILSRVSQGSIS